MSYDNTNSGALFRNESKNKPNQPDYNGRLNADGKEYWVAAWVKTAKSGKKFMSIALTEVEEQQPAAPSDFDVDEDMPF